MKKTTLLQAVTVLGLACMLSCGNNSTNEKAGTTDQAQASAEQQGTAHGHAHDTHPAHAGQDATAQASPEAAVPASSIPDFKFYILRSGIRFENGDLGKSGSHIFIFFDPSCGTCQEEAAAFAKHYDQIKGHNLYFISMNDPSLMSTFLDTHAKNLLEKPNVHMLYDRDTEFIKKIHFPARFPATYVYDANGLFKKHWVGDAPIQDVISAL